jgi:hypothetical protein
MDPLKYWAKIIIVSNPKKAPQSTKQLINIFIANLIILLMVSLFSLISHTIIMIFPAIGPILTLITLILMLSMTVSLFRRMRRVSNWRYKTKMPAE